MPGTEIIVFYPKDGVSKIQKSYMRPLRLETILMLLLLMDFDDAHKQM